MDINRSNMQDLYTGYQAHFRRGLAVETINFEAFTTVLPSTTDLERYPWLEPGRRMREWVGDRVIRNLATRKAELRNRKFEDTVGVPVDDIQDDKYDIYSMDMQEMGASANAIWADLAAELLVNARTAKWVDGKNFFAADRKVGSGVAGSVLNNRGKAKFSSAAYKAARAGMYKIKNTAGKVIGIRPSLLLIGPDFEEEAFQVLKSDLAIKSDANGAATTKNAWAGKSEYMVIPDLGEEWFLFDATRPIRPLVVQQRLKPALTVLDQPTDDNVFMKDLIVYGTKARGAGMWTMPQLAYASFPDEA